MATRPVIQAVREGFDISTADDKDFTVNTLKNQLKILSTGYGTTTIPASAIGVSQVDIIIEHNLGYKPFVMGWAKGEGDTKWRPVATVLSGNPSTLALSSGFTLGDNETVLTFYRNVFGTAFGDQDIEYRYLIFLDPSRDAWDS